MLVPVERVVPYYGKTAAKGIGVYVCLCVCAFGSWKMASDLLELEIQAAVSPVGS